MNMVVTAPTRTTAPGAFPERVRWMTASPLWNPIVQNQQGQPVQGPSLPDWNQPALLRFTTDTFMEDLIQLLQSNPEALQQQQAVKESFRARPVGTPADWQPPVPDQLKLYQPIHGYFYLVAASLVCHQPGLPDRVVNTASNEKVSFVLRRLSTDGTEMAWVGGVGNADGSGGKSWQPLPQQALADVYAFLADGEDLLPMFPLNFELNGRGRRLLIGLIPTSSRESYQAGQVAGAPSPFQPETNQDGQFADPRLEEVKTFVIEAIEHLDSYTAPSLSNAVGARLTAPTPPALEASQFILLDFAVFLSNNISQLWTALTTSVEPPLSDPSLALYRQLTTDTVDGVTTWRTALLDAFANQDKINNGDVVLSYDLSKMGIDINDPQNRLRTALYNNVQTALGPYTPPATPPSQGQLTLIPKLDTGATTQYVLRCVYQRPQCEPFRPPVVSAPTQPFVLAPFFDFDAPSRPIRITMPADTSIAGLRKFNKNVGFLISDKLRGQMERVTDLKKALDGKTGDEVQFDLGTICSFSIPIITICALFVLILFLILLNIVFWWLPFFRICLPIILPSKTGSGGGS